jgi:hypothetical protein
MTSPHAHLCPAGTLFTMRSNTPPANLTKHHIWALVKVVEAEAYISDIANKDEESIAPVAVLVAARSWIREQAETFAATDNEDLIEAISFIARDVSQLLSIDSVRVTMVEDSLRVLQRACIVVLDNLGAYRPKQEEPF